MKNKTLCRVTTLLTLVTMLAGCATSGPRDPRDPWEGMNRAVYKFNDTLDRSLLRPVARAYTDLTPEPVRRCIYNIFNNLDDVWSGTNSFLQGRGHDFANTLGRFLFNTTLGVGGCFDVASANNARKIRNDFGITLGVWGLGHGPYLVLPFLGPSSVRDGTGRIADWAGDPLAIHRVNDVPWRNSLLGLKVVTTRASLLRASDMVDRTALDPYSFVRDAYLQRRGAMVLGQKFTDEANLPYYDENEDPDHMPPVAAPINRSVQP
jgi:phospholipid-binding lipoprotein MlaA